MVLYRRNRVAGDAFRSVRIERPFIINAIIILPDHLHAVLTLPDGDADYSGRWRAIKSRFTHEHRYVRLGLRPDNWAFLPGMM